MWQWQLDTQNWVATAHAQHNISQPVLLWTLSDNTVLNAHTDIPDDVAQYAAITVTGRRPTSDAVWQGMLAHELGHVVLRHTKPKLGFTFPLFVLTCLPLVAPLFLRPYAMGAALAAVGVLLVSIPRMYAKQRADELAADKWAAQAGYGPQLQAYFKYLKTQGYTPSKRWQWTRTHPALDKRTKALLG